MEKRWKNLTIGLIILIFLVAAALFIQLPPPIETGQKIESAFTSAEISPQDFDTAIDSFYLTIGEVPLNVLEAKLEKIQANGSENEKKSAGVLLEAVAAEKEQTKLAKELESGESNLISDCANIENFDTIPDRFSDAAVNSVSLNEELKNVPQNFQITVDKESLAQEVTSIEMEVIRFVDTCLATEVLLNSSGGQ